MKGERNLMIILYNKDKELYYRIYLCVIDIHNDWEDYDLTPRFEKAFKNLYDLKRNAYEITNEIWENFRKQMDDWMQSGGRVRTYDEEKHYEIEVAVPLYKVFNDCGECINNGWADTLEDVQMSFTNRNSEKYTIVPYPAEECEFRQRLQRWSGEI